MKYSLHIKPFHDWYAADVVSSNCNQIQPRQSSI